MLISILLCELHLLNFASFSSFSIFKLLQNLSSYLLYANQKFRNEKSISVSTFFHGKSYYMIKNYYNCPPKVFTFGEKYGLVIV
jgi:hypothetical protein